MLVPIWLISTVYILAAARMVFSRQYEHAITRFFLAVAYFYIGTDIPIQDARALSRWFVLLLGVIEITSWMFRRWHDRRS
jgi:hypothetical protein